MVSLILATAARLLFPLLLLFSVFLLLRGHNLPGGGFAGGLVASSAFVLHAIAFNPASAMGLLRFEPRSLVGTGLLLALGSGLPGFLTGAPFLTGLWAEVKWDGMFDLKIGTPLVFDIGVYLVVLGVTLMILLPMEEEALEVKLEDAGAELGV